MKKTFMFYSLMILLFLENFGLEKIEKLKSLSTAIENITKFLYERSGEILISKFKDDKETIESLIVETAKNCYIPLMVRNIRTLNVELFGRKQYFVDGRFEPKNSIVTVSSFEKLIAYLDMKSKKYRHDWSINYKAYLTYVHAFDSNLDFLWKIDLTESRIREFYFIIEDEDFISLKTFVWFSQGHQCGAPRLMEVNSFSRKKNVWRNSEFNLKKFRNFYGCGIEVNQINSRSNVVTQAIYKLALQTKNRDLLRREFAKKNILDLLMNHLNFTKAPKKPKIVAIGKPFFENFAVSWPLIDRIESRALNKTRMEHFYTQPLMFNGLCFGVPVGEPYNSYEKLVLPFDDEVWILIILTFIVTFIIIFLLKFMTFRIKDYVIGENVSSPAFNVILIVFGFSQDPLPQRNFTRFLLIVFILYCLIMRTAWQGKMFEFMQQDMRKPEVKSIEEMIEKNFTLYIESDVTEALRDSDFVNK